MAPVLIAIVSLVVLGIPVTLALDRRARGALLLGTAFLYGSGTIFLVLLALSIFHVTWTLLSAAIVALIVWSALWFVRTPATGDRRPATPHLLDVVTLWTVLGYAIYATIAPVWEWDFWAIWGLKARVFFEHGAIDWRFLESGWNVFCHPDYPQLLPLNYVFLTLANGSWSDRWLGFLMVAYAVALLLIVRTLVAQETTPFVAAFVTAALASLAVSRYVGMAEGPLIAFGAAAVLFLRRALLYDDRVGWRHGAVLLGFAMNVKNEGIALATAVAIALLLVKPRTLWRLWPAVVIAAPWQLLRAMHVLPTDIVGGPILARVIDRIRLAVPLLRFLIDSLHEPWFWVALCVGILVAPASRRYREAFVLITTAVQLSFSIAAYFATPNNPQWHIVTSWPRLTVQAALPITYAVLLMLAVYFPGGQESPPDAEARPIE